MGNLKVFQERYIALRHIMICDGLSIGLPIHGNNLHHLTERLSAEGTSFVLVTLPQLGKALDLGLVSGMFFCPTHFRRKKGTQLPMFMYTLFERIFTQQATLRVKPCVDSIRFLRLFLSFDSKLITEPTEEQKEKAVAGFSNRMVNLRKFKIQQEHPVLLLAQELIGKALAGLDLTHITPGHGPGAVAEGHDREERWDFTSWPLRAEKEYPYLMYGTPSLRASLERGVGIPLTRQAITRCCLVPKDFKGPRLISAEVTVNQYLQQGQMKKIMHYVAKHPILSQSIKLQDQTRNQKLAQKSYEDGTITLDLSDASDTISVPLFWFLFKKVPRLRRQLMATRSDYMLYADKKIRLSAFAPMGSATCFPVETLIFWSLAMAACKISSLRSDTEGYTASDKAIAQSIGVFGDDIVIPDRAFHALYGTLTSVGCVVNTSKTCTNTPFRESCGSEWYGDIDVSIIRNKRYDYEQLNVATHPVLCDLQRKFFLRGYLRTASYLGELVQTILPTHTNSLRSILQSCAPGELLPHIEKISNLNLTEWMRDADFYERTRVCADRFSGLLSYWPDYPSGCKLRFNKSLQRTEARLPTLIQKSREWRTEGYSRLMARVLGDTVERITIRDRKIKMVWTLVPGLSAFTDNLST